MWPDTAGPLPSGRAEWLASGFVLFALFALLVTPLLLNQRADAARRGVVDPAIAALGAVNDVRQSFSQGEAAVRGLLLTGEPRFREALLEAESEQRRALGYLTAMVGHLDPDLAADVGELRAQTERAAGDRRTLMEELVAGRIPDDLLLEEEARHERLLENAARVEARVMAITAEGRASIEGTTRLAAVLTTALALLALLAGGMVLRAGRRYRRRAVEEAELRAAAFALAEPTEVADVLGRIAETVAKIRKGEHAFVERIDREAGDVVVVASAGAHAPAPGTRAPYPGSLTEEAIRTRSAEVVLDLAGTDRPVAGILPEACRHCVALVVPLITDNDPQGALVILRAEGSRFSRREIAHRRALGVLAAITLRKAVLLERARTQQATLERVAASRERLVRGFSHDVKNPLGAADGHAQLLLDGILGELEPRQAESLKRIRSGIGSALELIESLVDLARAEAGQLEVDRTRVDIAELTRETARIYQGVADTKGIALRVHDPETVLAIESDPRRVRQILGNLLSNAIKYTRSGGDVRIATELRAGRRARDPGRWVTIAVQDTGRGIPAEGQDRLFTEFGRVEPGETEGAGLGLAISDRLANLLGGEITVESEEGVGSTFTLWLPTESGNGAGAGAGAGDDAPVRDEGPAS